MVLCDIPKVLNLYINGDLPGVAPFAGHAGHISHYPCRICCVRGDDTEGRGRPGRPGRYVGALKEAPLGTLEDFEHGTKNVLLPLNPLVPLCTFTGPMFFALDELHLIGHGICKHLYRLYIGKYDVKGATTTYSLGSSAWGAVANDLSSNSIDHQAFENVFRLPAKQRSHRAVDWIGLLSYVFLALSISRMHMDCIDPTMAITTFIQYTQQHELTYDNLDIMDNCLHTFNLFVDNAMHNNTIHVSFLTPTVHYLLFNIPGYRSSTNEQLFADVLFYITISENIYAVALVNEANQDSQNLMLCTSTDQQHRHALIPALYIH